MVHIELSTEQRQAVIDAAHAGLAHAFRELIAAHPELEYLARPLLQQVLAHVVLNNNALGVDQDNFSGKIEVK